MSLVFLKLGGSLITDKDKTDTPDLPKLKEISREISSALHDEPNLQLVVGHGSGSFGHHAAHRYNTHQGVYSPEEWLGFAHVWERAHALNLIVTQNLVDVGIPVISFSPSSFIITNDHAVSDWDAFTIQTALENRLIPLIHGDVVFDLKIGGTILSTEDLFITLANHILPDRILLAGIEPGVWQNYPARDEIIPSISSRIQLYKKPSDLSSSSVDVTGGMGSKIENMVKIVDTHPNTRITIFSGVESGNIYSSLMGNMLGTSIVKSEKVNQ